jgi:cellulose synthase/poly-beta-1,6-N-acetylglucosamine synthase-like glycosyltransferase
VRKSVSDVSIIVPCREIDFYADRCFQVCKLIYPQAEIRLVTDSLCPGFPAEKRNWGMRHTLGSVLAFLDSDAYPSPTWLQTALFALEEYPAVCGPGILPPTANLKERIADIVYQMLPYSYRVVQMRSRIVPEYPTFNLIVLRELATEFDSYLTGEDTLFTRRIKGGIFYHPDILVYHNRRPVFKPLWKQVGTYGRHRGNLIRLAFFAWLSTMFTYSVNFVIGFFRRKP